ncbi:MAG: hypothetical protein HYX67_05795 [Candidatus Melainabacteria bacterium]|nr:hypothetical protein [Candidatus Melainabacteria bacterium]
MKITQALWGTMFLLINLPPTARPADDSHSAGTAIGTLSRSMSPSDGAAGLFTPNTPGNAAAYDAQLNGGLTASPIVDGSGANITITVPVATPPAATSAQTGLPGSRMLNTAKTGSSYEVVAPKSTNALAPYAVARQAPRNLPSFAQRRTVTLAKPQLVRRFAGSIKSATVTSQPSNSIESIGQLTGTITYADGQRVLLGTLGNATIDPNKGTVTLPNGAKLPMRSAEKLVRQVAQKNQVRL